MFKIDTVSNRISRIETKRFGDLGFREREHLQESTMLEAEIIKSHRRLHMNECGLVHVFNLEIPTT